MGLPNCLPCQYVLMPRQKSAGCCPHWNYRDAKACMLMCVYGGGGVGTPPQPWAIVRNLFNLVKNRSKSGWRDTCAQIHRSHPFSHTLNHAVRCWTYFTHPIWNGVLTPSTLGEIQLFYTSNMISGSKVLCIAFHLNLLCKRLFVDSFASLLPRCVLEF